MMFQTRCAGCDEPGEVICTTCRFALVGPRPRLSGLDVRAAVPFTGRARRVVLGLKYRNRRRVARHLAGLVVNALLADGCRADVVTWAPTGAGRRRDRGFDQGELLARYVARQLGLPARALLRRSAGSRSQTGRSRSERLAGVRFDARPRLGGLRILVVDDVVTTGATLLAARAALRAAGATTVDLYAVAATPAANRVPMLAVAGERSPAPIAA